MAEAYMAEVVNPDMDIESDKCTVDDIVMGTQSNDNTESNSAEQGQTRVPKYVPTTPTSHLRGPRKGETRVPDDARGRRNRKLCRGSSPKVLQLYLEKKRSLAPPYGHASGTTLLDCDGCLAPLIWRVPQERGQVVGQAERAITTDKQKAQINTHAYHHHP